MAITPVAATQVINMKIISNIAGFLLSFIFLFSALNFFFHFMDMPAPPAGSPPAMFLGAMIGTGYFTMIKVLEIIGGILVAVPKTRSLGLLVLGPIIVNIMAFHVFMLGGYGLVGLPAFAAALSLFLLWTKRDAFSALLK